jgi:hypothetical protein
VVAIAPTDTASRRIGQTDVWLGATIHRVPYDTEAVARDMIRRGLPATLAAGVKVGLEEHDAIPGTARRADEAQSAAETPALIESEYEDDAVACGLELTDHCMCPLDDRIAAYEALARIFRGELAEVSPALHRLRLAMRSCRINRNVNEEAILDAFHEAEIALRTAGGRAAFEAERERLYGQRSGFDPFAHVLSPEEVTYRSGDIHERAASIETAYADSGFHIPTAYGEEHPPGHISTELDFMAFCLRGAAAADYAALDRANDFFRRHLAEWAMLFAVVVGQQAKEPVMRFAGLALDKFLTCEGSIFHHAAPTRCYLRAANS